MAPMTVQKRGQQLSDKVVAEVKSAKQEVAAEANTLAKTSKAQYERFQLWLKDLTQKITVIVKNPQFQTATITTTSGAVTFGTIGGAFGLASGVVVGSAAGVVPAIFTFGLSIPAGAVVGGGTGLCVGAASGTVGGGAAGYGAYKYRVEIQNGVVFIKRKSLDTTSLIKTKVRKTADAIGCKVAACTKATRVKFTFVVDTSTKFAKAKYAQARSIAATRSVQVTAASAATGGAAGTVAGATAGIVAGAAVGVVPALFTFGLSIPIGAAMGLCAGAFTGGAVGTVSGGAIGYSGYTHRKEISDGAQKTWSKACGGAEAVKKSVKTFVHGGTGGTA